jgi:hypothetical protein
LVVVVRVHLQHHQEAVLVVTLFLALLRLQAVVVAVLAILALEQVLQVVLAAAVDTETH